MEAHILQLLRQGDDSGKDGGDFKYRNNIQYPKKQYPLNKSVKQGKLHQNENGKHMSKSERAKLIENFSKVSAYY